ncbi:MAG TPA: hypothetical protein VGE77_02465 [Nocardioides sp.]
MRVTAAGEQVLSNAAAVVARLDAEFTAAHPGLTEALREVTTAALGDGPGGEPSGESGAGPVQG